MRLRAPVLSSPEKVKELSQLVTKTAKFKLEIIVLG
jgi:hypothetical protein